MKNEKIVAGLINKAFATIFLVHNCQRRDISFQQKLQAANRMTQGNRLRKKEKDMI